MSHTHRMLKPTKQPLIASLGLSFLALIYGSLPAKAQYTVRDLNPPGFQQSVGLGISGSIQVGQAFDPATGEHAVLWNGTAASVVNLNPAGYDYSNARAAFGKFQVGGAYSPTAEHAFLWSGTAASAIDLHPTLQNYTHSAAYGVSATQQVGIATFTQNNTAEERAALWSGSAASFVNLHPQGFVSSIAVGISGTTQVGSGVPGASISKHALLWNGTAASMVDLHPGSGFTSSQALGVSGASQVGFGVDATTGLNRALLWQGTAASAIDLTPEGFTDSIASGISGNFQVGYGIQASTSQVHALLWNNSAGSFIDLHNFVSTSGVSIVRSQATGIDSDGNIIGYGVDAANLLHALLWSVEVPEPSSYLLTILGLGLLGITLRRQKVRINN